MKPTQPGWYWLQLLPTSPWVVDLVRPDWLDPNELFYAYSGRRVSTTEMHACVGPMKPPDGVAAQRGAMSETNNVEADAERYTDAEVDTIVAKCAASNQSAVALPAVTSKWKHKDNVKLTASVIEVRRKGRGYEVVFIRSDQLKLRQAMTLTAWKLNYSEVIL